MAFLQHGAKCCWNELPGKISGAFFWRRAYYYLGGPRRFPFSFMLYIGQSILGALLEYDPTSAGEYKLNRELELMLKHVGSDNALSSPS